MACPFASEPRGKSNSVTYSTYLQVEELLKCVKPLTNFHDEHLFIVTHQTYELWFKQIVLEIDSIRSIFLKPRVNEKNMLTVNSRLNRIVKILAVISDQIKILETMTPMDFAEFRGALESASGFQSWQFRLIENKLGIKKENRIKYNEREYTQVFASNLSALLEETENQKSIFDLVETWLERTPGMETETFDFVKELKRNCNKWFREIENTMKNEHNPQAKNDLESYLNRTKENFDEVFSEEKYNIHRRRGDRRLSWHAFHGALMIYFYRDEVLFHEPFQMINLLMDIDCLIMKWRSNHVLLVQRQIGSKLGTGGSSGYRYLRATMSDRYKAFVDFFNLSNYLVPKEYIPDLKAVDRKRLNSVSMIPDYAEPEK